MTNTSSNSQEDHGLVLNIEALALPALNNPALGRAEYWNLNGKSFGSAAFQPAWQFATGAGITISIVDEGVNYTHLDLVDRFDRSLDYDPLDLDENDARPDSPTEDHGTRVAGIIAGSATNTIGTIGAALEATITASYLRYGTLDIDSLARIFTHQANVHISNNSWGFTSAFADNANSEYFAPVMEALEFAATAGRGGLGTAMVFAAGNSKVSVAGQNIGDDANFHSLSNSRFSIAVGAHDSTGESSFFSSPGTNVLLSAPGMSLLTTTGLGDGASGATEVSGTSFAAPMVSSAIALMLEVNANLGYRDIQEILAISSDPSRSGLTVSNGATNVNGGGMMFDREMGFGALNALSAVNLARSWTAQHAAANEEHIAAAFLIPVTINPLTQILTCDIVNPGTDDFSLDFVELTLVLEDTSLRDLRIELISADGTCAVIAPNLKAAGGRTTLDFTFSSVVTWGESPFGTWTLKLIHPNASESFNILGAQLDLYGDTVSADDDHIFTASYERLVSANRARAVITDTDGGTDRLNFAAASAAVTASLSGGVNSINKTKFTLAGDFENIYGSIHADIFTGSAGSNVIEGDYGNDRIYGLGGDDFLYGGAGDDTIEGGAGADLIDGGAGVDTVVYSSTVKLDFATGEHSGDAAGDLFVRIERFQLSGGHDVFIGSAAAVNETVLGGGGKDTLDGGAGNDYLDGGADADLMIGGLGDDVFVFNVAGDIAIELAGEGIDKVISSLSTTLGANIENLELTGSAQRGTGNELANIILGNNANNKLYGNAGDDRLEGRKGNDTLEGGAGADTLVGGVGKDLLKGGQGRDVFTFTDHGSIDRIADFRRGEDLIDLSAIDASTRAAGNNAFTFIGTGKFTKAAGQLHYNYSGKQTIVTGDINGDGRIDFKLVLDGRHALTADDFFL